MRYRIIVGRSKLKPQLCTLTSDGQPIGSSISGRNILLFPILYLAKISRAASQKT